MLRVVPLTATSIKPYSLKSSPLRYKIGQETPFTVVVFGWVVGYPPRHLYLKRKGCL